MDNNEDASESDSYERDYSPTIEEVHKMTEPSNYF